MWPGYIINHEHIPVKQIMRTQTFTKSGTNSLPSPTIIITHRELDKQIPRWMQCIIIKYVILLKIAHTNAFLSFKKSWQNLNIILISSKLGAFGQYAEYQPTIWYINNYHPSSTIQRAEAAGVAGEQLFRWSPPIARWWAGPAAIARSACLFSLWRLRVETITQSSLLSLPPALFPPPPHQNLTPFLALSLTLSHSHLAITTSSLPRLPHLPHFFVRRSATARLRCPFEVLFSGLWSFGDLVIWARGYLRALWGFGRPVGVFTILESRLWGEAALASWSPAAMATGGRFVAGSHNRNEFIVINADEVGRVSAWKRFLPSRFTDFRPSAQFCDGKDGCFSCYFPR